MLSKQVNVVFHFIRRFVLVIYFICLMSCSGSRPVKVDTAFSPDSLVFFTDSFGVNGHSYIRFLDYSGNFQVLHNPDCFCRYNRTFIVVKHVN